MDLSGLSSAAPAELPKERPVGPVDIPFDARGAPYALIDEKADQIVEAENQKLDELMDRFTKGFDPGSFGSYVTSSLEMLVGRLFPGSYCHFLLLLFATFDAVQGIQLNMESWIRRRYPRTTIIHPSETSLTDETFFAAEIEMLRKLVEPIREGNKKSIFWLNSRRAEPAPTCEQLEASIRAIELFKIDIGAALKASHDNRTFYSGLPVSVERTAVFSMKQLRLDACRATLHWDRFGGSELEFTSFFRHYKAHISKNEPERARAIGWLPPSSPQTPRQSAQEADEGDLVSWICEETAQDKVIDLLIKTAMWLSVARGLAAVHLFCDVARLFVLREPSQEANDEYLCFLQYITRLRASTEGAPFCSSPLVPRENKIFPTRNVDYFEDVWRTSYMLSQGLYEEISWFEKHKAANFKLQQPPQKRRSGHGNLQVITPVPIRGTLAGIPCTPEESPSKKGSADDYDIPSLSPETSSVYRSRTV